VIYYVVSGGLHPFGDALRHQANIAAGDYSLSALQADGWCLAAELPSENSLLTLLLPLANILMKVSKTDIYIQVHH